jgi:CheY-like chemotaxis protein
MTGLMNRLPILYVEDDENDVYFMRRAFRKLGLSELLFVTRDGEEGIEYLSGTGKFSDREAFPLPALVLLDLKMPRRSGREVLAWIRGQPEFRTLKVVMFTSSTQESDLAFCGSHGADGYVMKPSRADLIDSLLTRILAAMDASGSDPGRLDFADNLLRNELPGSPSLTGPTR